MKCRNITVQDMLNFYGVMIWIYIKPCNIGGYTSYFESILIICCVQRYTISLEAYGGWDIKIMSISRFRNIRSAYNPKFGESAVGDKCHQLIFMFRCINQAAARNFDLGPNADFDEGGIANRSIL